MSKETNLYRPGLNKELAALSRKPIVLSLLYDLDLLPEQLESQEELTLGLFAAYNRLEGVLLAFKTMELVAENEVARLTPERQLKTGFRLRTIDSSMSPEEFNQAWEACFSKRHGGTAEDGSDFDIDVLDIAARIRAGKDTIIVNDEVWTRASSAECALATLAEASCDDAGEIANG